jgi:GDSL-like Lipase/Acylhydrolase family
MMKIKKLASLFFLFCFITSFNPKEISWVAIGDSITYLNDHADETRNRITKGYMTRVVEKLPDIHYINGWTSGRIASSLDTLKLTRADVYSVFLGTNDWWQGRPLGVFEDYQNHTGNHTVFGSFRVIMNKLRSLNKDAALILITPMQRVDFVYINNMKNNAYGSYKEKNEQSLAQFANAIAMIAKFEHIKVVDLYNNPHLGLKNLVKFKRLKDPQSGLYKNYPYPQFIGIPFNPKRMSILTLLKLSI